MATITFNLNPDTKLTDEQERMIDAAKKRPFTYDSENPPLTEEELKHFVMVEKEVKNASI